MGIRPAEFTSAGQTSRHYIPGAYSRRNTLSSRSGVSSGKLCIIGVSTGGKPRTLIPLSGIAEAKEILQGGTLLDGVAHAFTGSRDYIPQTVYAMRINDGTQSTRTMTRDGVTFLTLKSKEYGQNANRIKMWYRAGTTGKRITVSYRNDEYDIDNIGKTSMSVLYTGEGASAKCTVNATGLTLAAFDSDDQPIEADGLYVPWAECTSMEDLVTRINDTDKYTAAVVGAASDDLPSELDHVTDVAVSSETAEFTSDFAALISALKTVPFIESVTASGNSRQLPDDEPGYIYFSGATAGTSTVQDWGAALEALEKEDVQIIAAPVTDSAIHALIAEHCSSMSSVSKKRERTCWLGMSPETSIDSGIAAAKQFDNEFVSLVITSAGAADPMTGESMTVSPAYLACKCAGMEAGASVGTPLTNKKLNVYSFGVKYSETELDRMIAGGVVPFGENDNGNLVCIRAITTCQEDNLIKNERSMTRAVCCMDRDLRNECNRDIGSNDETDESTVIQVLMECSKSWYAQGLISKNDNGELFEDAKVIFDGDKTYLTFERYVRAPRNFEFITATNKVYRSTVEIG